MTFIRLLQFDIQYSRAPGDIVELVIRNVEGHEKIDIIMT